ncbi:MULTISPECIES: hypothetical protein [Rhodococcus]|jgi:hypothetical protein|uniref:Uncharacterized protein n=1 Tax=Rhodococcus oxybenzonivorans TaxID=1990687 RepID=A0AAE4V136_9NOCA|nr:MULTISPECIES: hypothetical protein [Rhodococcus]MDV7241931.1 hypothetical protein [Rhodococcus oxybenzonivorans]MDV7266560.1 hypothetical protein [Rhodococcus oxybenzonivorans]MDV7277805.1 hypothetical protein [Rhodococcus oxybenzonivorans]MDV7334213.1 hypothetical protein [Rhodococcus oxybenzonivorans]MDV7343632.1 hypothetical protein [Rhodococcus oxybenzonivorans]
MTNVALLLGLLASAIGGRTVLQRVLTKPSSRRAPGALFYPNG